MTIWLPDVEQVTLFHEKLIRQTGGAEGARSMALVESAINRANASFGGVDAWKSLEQKAAAVACGLVQNHGFVDGNKRVGIAVMLLILRKNGYSLAYAQPELIALGLDMATGKADVSAVTAWIQAHQA